MSRGSGRRIAAAACSGSPGFRRGSQLQLTQPEQTAFLVLLTVDTREGQCQLFFHEYCTLKELVGLGFTNAVSGRTD